MEACQVASVKVERDVSASPAVVWGIITDLDRSAEVIGGIIKIERLDDGSGFEVGTAWNETRKMFGREATERLEVAHLEPGHSYTVEASGPGVRYVTVMAVEPKAAGTLLSMSFEGHATSVAAKIGAFLGRFLTGKMRQLIEQDLADIATAAEQAASKETASN